MKLSITIVESLILPIQEPKINKLEGHRFKKNTLKVKGK